MNFDADKYYVEDKKLTLGGRTFNIPIVPAATSLIIAKNSKEYAKFGTTDEDTKSRQIAFEIIASVLNQRIPQGQRVSSKWVEDHLDMRMMNELIMYIFEEREEEKEEKKSSQGSEGGK